MDAILNKILHIIFVRSFVGRIIARRAMSKKEISREVFSAYKRVEREYQHQFQAIKVARDSDDFSPDKFQMLMMVHNFRAKVLVDQMMEKLCEEYNPIVAASVGAYLLDQMEETIS